MGLLKPDQEGQEREGVGVLEKVGRAQSAGVHGRTEQEPDCLAGSRTSEQQQWTTRASMGLPGKEMKAGRRMSTSPEHSEPVFSSGK